MSKSPRKTFVKAKKHLGQHFLKDEAIAKRIADTLSFKGYHQVLEIGPGTGVLTKYLIEKDIGLVAMDLDVESIAYLKNDFQRQYAPVLRDGKGLTIVQGDFLNFDLSKLFGNEPFAITGNFPYNISTQIVFKTLEMRHQVPEFTGMFQKEVAQRICASEGNKTYGIISVLTQVFYETEYLFTVPPHVFIPPPKVESGVIRLVRKNGPQPDFDKQLFFKVVKMAFNQRRKTLRNSLKSLGLPDILKEDAIFDRRPEQLSVAEFLALVKKIGNDPI
nr:16S rRNA (adenine(1518)-N(6)/adenine(1519)-N(6))-dimethyltransferase RsmA [Allomuricauda sp.]